MLFLRSCSQWFVFWADLNSTAVIDPKNGQISMELRFLIGLDHHNNWNITFSSIVFENVSIDHGYIRLYIFFHLVNFFAEIMLTFFVVIFHLGCIVFLIFMIIFGPYFSFFVAWPKKRKRVRHITCGLKRSLLSHDESLPMLILGTGTLCGTGQGKPVCLRGKTQVTFKAALYC